MCCFFAAVLRTQNFLEHYTKTKAPFPLFFHAAWFFNRPHRKEGFLKFVDSILALPDVYFVTSQEVIAWTRFPEPLPQVRLEFNPQPQFMVRILQHSRFVLLLKEL
jgi:hypothetical protein